MSIATPDLQSPPPSQSTQLSVREYRAILLDDILLDDRGPCTGGLPRATLEIKVGRSELNLGPSVASPELYPLHYWAKCFGFCLFGHNDLLLVFLLFWHAPLAVRGAKHRQQSLQSGWFWAILITSIGERFFDFRSWCSIVWNHVTRGRPGGLLQSFGEEAVKILSVRFVRHSCNVPKQEEVSWMDYGQEMGGLLYWWAKSSLLVTLSTTTKRKRWMWYVQCCQLIDWLTDKLLWPLTEAYVVLESATVRLETNLGGARERCSECVCIQVYYRF